MNEQLQQERRDDPADQRVEPEDLGAQPRGRPPQDVIPSAGREELAEHVRRGVGVAHHEPSGGTRFAVRVRVRPDAQIDGNVVGK
jgi:hypothetical protein